MDFRGMVITIKPGCMEKVSELLSKIFSCGPKDRGQGQQRWRIIRKEGNWYTPADYRPSVAVFTFDIYADKIKEMLIKEGLAV